MSKTILLCTDLDRTLVPNGLQPESPEARPLFRVVASQPEVTLVYASGRSRDLQLEAIQHYGLPMPNFAIGDVGTTIYRITKGVWEAWDEWSGEIAGDWQGMMSADLADMLGEPDPLRLQEPARQNSYKLSYYAPAGYDPALFRAHLDEVLAARGTPDMLVELTWSVDETRRIGLLDVVPARSTKLHALEFLIREQGIDPRRCLFAGDSGNDLPVLASGIPSVLVRNARDDVRREAIRQAGARDNGACLYLARGGLKGMNGNYAAGILEGLIHFLPETARWL